MTMESPPQYSLADVEDTKLAETESDNQNRAYGNWNMWANNWNSLETVGGWWRSFAPNSLPPVPMPIVIDEDDMRAHVQRGRVESVFYDYEEPPPPPFHIPQMHLEDEDARNAMHMVDHYPNHSYITVMQSVSMENRQTRMRSHTESSDEEADALRSFLLSSLRSNKPSQPPRPTPVRQAPPPPKIFRPSTLPPSAINLLREGLNASYESDDPEELRSFLLSSIATRKAVKARCNFGAFPSKKKDDPARKQHLIPPVIKKSDNQKESPIESVSEPPPTSIAATFDKPVTYKFINQTSLSPKIIRIVKKNKVINRKATAKRKMPVNKALYTRSRTKRPSTLMVKEPNAPLHSSWKTASSTRLIKNMDPATIKVKKLVISLAEESAASDDDLELNSIAYTSCGNTAGPLSLATESASGSTIRSNTPLSEIGNTNPAPNTNLTRTVINDHFNQKINDYLKQARSQAPATSSPKTTLKKMPEKPKVAGKRKVSLSSPMRPTKISPGAVKHLPVASQKEYLRLIERMQVLEKKKQLEAKASSSTKSGPNPAGDKPPDAKVPMPNPNPNAPSESRLKAFENAVKKVGGNMITNLDKSLNLVEEATKSKTIQLECSQRLRELYAEMQSVKEVGKQEELKLSQIEPEIQTNRETIISLNQERHKLHTRAMVLGRDLGGDDYKLLDESKATITEKSTQLSKEIRLYNSIVKYDDLKNLTAGDPQPKSVIEQEEEPSGKKPPELEASDANKSGTGRKPMPQDNPGQSLTEPGPFFVIRMRELRKKTAKKVGSLKNQIFLTYQSPMSRNYNSDLDPHAIMCPFDLMGICQDVDCIYLHLPRPDGRTHIQRRTSGLISNNQPENKQAEIKNPTTQIQRKRKRMSRWQPISEITKIN
nr:uncharacterized protein LOC108120176 [Drosophila bipectinata]